MANWNAVIYMAGILPQYEFLGRGKPPKSLEDWNGMRVRAGGGVAQAMEKLGATLMSVPATEVYTLLERGTVDAVSFPYYAPCGLQGERGCRLVHGQFPARHG